jgi:uncharacterized protein (DUF1800 family)
MTTREKIAHLYRRLGFGATPEELDAGVKLGVKGTTDLLIDYDKVDEGFPVSPQEFIWRDNNQPDIGTYRYRLWWVMRMICTQRPLQEKLTLFWHNHFAVGDDKVDDGPMMLNYLETLRANSAGTFEGLLNAISKDPAMMRYLDMQHSVRGNPNENFPREVMELFTLGLGNYTEDDVKAAAKSLTGWGYIQLFNEFKGDTEHKVMDWLTFDRPFTSFIHMPAMHDPSPKTFLGKTEAYDGDSLLAVLANHPATAKHLGKKLWEYFAYRNPEPAVVDRMAMAFTRSKGDIRKVLRIIVNSKEFWSDKCVRKEIKSPADFCIGIARQMGAGQRLLADRDPKADKMTPIPTEVVNSVAYVSNRMDKAGMLLLRPPNVSGWRWGEAWVSPAAMVERYRYRGLFIRGPKGPDVGAKNTLAFIKGKNPKNSADMAKSLAEFFDVALPPASVAILGEDLDKLGGVKLLDNEGKWAAALNQSMLLLMAAPETHFC